MILEAITWSVTSFVFFVFLAFVLCPSKLTIRKMEAFERHRRKRGA